MQFHPFAGRSICLTVCQCFCIIDPLVHLDVTQLSALHQFFQPPCILLQHPKLLSRAPGLTGNYWSQHRPSDYNVFYDSLDDSFIVSVAASGFWWWTWWGQRREKGKGGERRENNAETREGDRVMCQRREYNRYVTAWHHLLACLAWHQALCQ